MPTYTQDNRFIRIDTTLGVDELLLQSFNGEEGVSRLFHFELAMHSENRSIQFDSIVGKKATVTVFLPDGSQRYINGIISSFSQGGSSPLEGGTVPTVFTSYYATLVPWLWALTRTSDCRIFQNLSVPDIIAKVFKDHGFSDFANRLYGAFDPREYCVQYRETDFNFVSRLMEEEGIFYFFEHTQDKHILVLANRPNEFKPSPLHKEVSYKSVIGDKRDEDVINEWRQSQEVRPGQYTLTDYNFQQPTRDLTATVIGKDERKLEIYDYPGEYREKGQGERLTGVRMEEEQTPLMVISGSSYCAGFTPGYRFDLRDHYRRDFNKSYVLTSVSHSADQGTDYRSSAEHAAAEFHYANRFQCVPHPTAFRPPRLTPTPVVQGSQTAIVVGPAGEEIYVDKYGRVKVQFHWDRESKYNENSSCWVRVSQNWAGKRWGAMFIPRIGQEVIVDFLEGDPDQPIITGRVYNGDSMPPYALPDEKTKSAIKSNSSKGGGGFNEIRFEDKKGEEQLFIHAEKQQDVRVKKDSLEWIGAERHLIVKQDQLEKVEGDKHLQIKGDQNEKVDGTVSLKAGMDLQQKVGMKAALDAGTEIHLKAGVNLVIESGVTLTLKVGRNFINLNPAGVFIQGTMVMINSGGAAGSGSGASPEAPKNSKEADKADPGAKPEMPPPKTPVKPTTYSPGALALKQAAQSGMPFTATGTGTENASGAQPPSPPEPIVQPVALQTHPTEAPTGAPAAAAAKELLTAAKLSEPKITSYIGTLAKETGGKMEGLDFRLKSEESLARKLQTTPPDQIKDALRYTLVYDSKNISANANHVMKSLEQSGFEKLRVKNTFGPDQQYQGINTIFRSPERQVFELQFHTPESFNVKQNLTHGIYEKLRVLPDDSPKKAELEQQITNISNEVIPLPTKIDGVKNFP